MSARRVDFVKLLGALLLAPLLCHVGAAASQEKDSLFQAIIPVADRSKEERNRAFSEGLITVLVKNSGTRDILNHFLIRAALERAEILVTEFSFLRPREERDLYIHGYPDIYRKPHQPLQLRIRFQKSSVQELLQRAGIAIWPEPRPPVTIWLAVQDEQDETRFASPESATPLLDALLAGLRQRGVSSTLPLMDIEDRSKLLIDDVKSGTRQPLEVASRRYDPRNILSGRLLETRDANWRGRFHLFSEGEERLSFDVHGMPLGESMAHVADILATQLAELYAVRLQNRRQEAQLQLVGGLGSFREYAEVLQHLRELLPVQEARITWMDEQEMHFGLLLNAEVSELRKILRTDLKFVALPGEETALRYRLRE